MQDPEQLPVTVNLRLPWAYHQFLKRKATDRGSSFNALVMDALDRRYASEFVREQTRSEGATS